MTQAPAELAIDLMDGRFYADDPFPAFAWMRRHAPAFYDEPNDLWAIASHRDLKAAGADSQTFRNGDGHRPKFPPLPMMIDMDDPDHQRHRKLVSAGFTPKRVQEMTEHVRAVCDQVIDQVCETGRCDFVADIAAPLPLNMIGDMLGFAPADRPDLLRWSEIMLGSQGDLSPAAIDAATEAFVGFTSYMQSVIADRRASGAADDLAGILVHAEIDGEGLDEEALIYETLLILIGGDETTRHVISGGMLALLERPAQFELLRREPDRIPVAVEEMLRWVSPIKDMNRTTSRDVESGGATIPQGAEVLLLYPSANRDEAVFAEPDSFDVTRDPNPHLAFGVGSHFCLGNQLARLELKTMFEQLLSRLPDLHLAEPGPFAHRRSNFISGVESMAVEFTPTARIGA